jgi:hypothetical protein
LRVKFGNLPGGGGNLRRGAGDFFFPYFRARLKYGL